jgi:hypothetical protein
MFKARQIISPHKLIKNFGTIVKELSVNPQAILITPKRGDKLVLVNVDIFEDLFDFRSNAAIESSGSVPLRLRE